MKVVAGNKLAGVVRLKWERLYTGTEPDCYHAAAFAGDGSFIRVRVGPATANNGLYRQRVVNPGAQSDFSQWTYAGYYNCQAVAVVVASHGAEVNIVWADINQDIKRIQSTDYGVTWSTAQVIDSSPDPATGGMSISYKPNGDLAIFFTAGDTLYVKKRVGGVWQNSSFWDKTTGQLASVAAVYDGDWHLLVSGQDTAGNYKVWSLIYGDSSGVWSELKEWATAPASGDFEYRSIFLSKPDVYRTFYVEKFTGQQSYSRPYWSHSVKDTDFASGLWREPVPFDCSYEYGLAIAYHGDYTWLSAPNGVWRAELAVRELELSGDARSVRSECRPYAASLTVELDNADGCYHSPGQGDINVLETGCQLNFSPGYVTAQGKEFSAGPAFWLESYEHVRENGKAVLVLHGIDGWGLLAHWRAQHQFRWNKDGGTTCVRDILAFVLGRSGFKIDVLSQSSVITSFCPDFTIHAGDSGIAIVERLLAFVPDVLFIEGEKAYLLNLLSDDVAVYSYGTQHGIFSGKYSSGAWPLNQIRVAGEANEITLIVDAYAWAEIDKFPERWAAVTDKNIVTLAQSGELAAAILLKAGREAIAGLICVPVNCGQQLWDVIEITDVSAGLSAAKRRVTGIVLTYHPAGAVYEQKLLLGGV